VAPTIENITQSWSAGLAHLFKDTATSIKKARHPAVIFSRKHEDFFIMSFTAAYPESHVSLLIMDDLLPYVVFEPHAERLRVTALYAIALSGIQRQ
jgi:hypothetical protein